jgi:predicted nuclease of predicted toxin-antitoxin system
VSLDTDFANIIRYPPEKYAGIIVLRITNPSSKKITEALMNFLSAVKEENIEHSLVVVEQVMYRIRRAR